MASVQYKSEFPRIAARLEREAAASIDRVAHFTAGQARARVPVRTGKTQASIRVMGRATAGPASLRRRVRVRFPGHLLEYGTENMRARPFMGPAARQAENSMLREARRWFRT